MELCPVLNFDNSGTQPTVCLMRRLINLVLQYFCCYIVMVVIVVIVNIVIVIAFLILFLLLLNAFLYCSNENMSYCSDISRTMSVCTS